VNIGYLITAPLGQSQQVCAARATRSFAIGTLRFDAFRGAHDACSCLRVAADLQEGQKGAKIYSRCVIIWEFSI